MKGETIIMLAGGSLKGIMQRHRQLALRFARDNTVIYIDEPGNIITVFLTREKPISNLWSWLSGLKKYDDNLLYWTPPPGPPFGMIYPSLNAWNHFWFRTWYRILCRRMPKNPILIFNNVIALPWLGFFNEGLRIYDCCDEVTGFFVPSLRPDMVLRQERKLIEACDLLICTSQKLMEAKSPIAKNAALIHNAAEIKHFRKALKGDMPRPDHLAAIEKPIVGFWGYLSEWVAWDIIEYLVSNAPDLHFIFIGPMAKGASKRIKAENVTFTGPLPYDVLPQYLAHFSCAILPFVKNITTESFNPVKGYEYLAGGCPFVSTRLPGLSVFGEHVHPADDGPSFLQAVRRAIKEDSPEKRLARADFVAGQDWDARVEEIYRAVELLKK
jgi:glycosyltransferase involved in cell wall biosynthesis